MGEDCDDGSNSDFVAYPKCDHGIPCMESISTTSPGKCLRPGIAYAV